MSLSLKIVEDAIKKDPTLSLKGYEKETKISKRKLEGLIKTLMENGNKNVEFWYSTKKLRRGNYRILGNSLRIFSGLRKEYRGEGNFLALYEWMIDEIKVLDEFRIHKILKDYGASPSYGKQRSQYFDKAKKSLEEFIIQAQKSNVDLTICDFHILKPGF